MDYFLSLIMLLAMNISVDDHKISTLTSRVENQFLEELSFGVLSVESNEIVDLQDSIRVAVVVPAIYFNRNEGDWNQTIFVVNHIITVSRVISGKATEPNGLHLEIEPVISKTSGYLLKTWYEIEKEDSTKFIINIKLFDVAGQPLRDNFVLSTSLKDVACNAGQENNWYSKCLSLKYYGKIAEDREGNIYCIFTPDQRNEEFMIRFQEPSSPTEQMARTATVKYFLREEVKYFEPIY